MNNETPSLVIIEPLFAVIAAILFLLVLTPLARRFSLMDLPDARKKHEMAIPTVGGLAIYLSILSAMLLMDPPEKLGWLIASGSVLVVIGALDDAFGLGVRVRLVSQIFATGLMILGSGLSIQTIGLPSFGPVEFPYFVGIIITTFAIVGLTNGFNMVDGIDGLASGHVVLAIAFVSFMLYRSHGFILHGEWLSILLAAVLTFWLVNLSLTPLPKVFLGDAGSLFLGFIVGWILVYYSQKPIALIHPVAALWCVTIPVFDALVVIARRLKGGKSPFAPDRNHMHHILVDMGMRPSEALAVILLSSTAINAIGLLVTDSISPVYGLMLYLMALLGFGWGILNPRFASTLAKKLRLLIRY